MKKIALITHSFHKKTNSAPLYVKELFKEDENFKLDVFYNDEWGPKDKFNLFNTVIEGYDLVVVLQLISLNVLNKIKSKNIVFIPMFDYSRNFSIPKWSEAFNLKILSPTKGLSFILKNIGLDYFDIKYYPQPNFYIDQNFENVFFWNRVKEIDYKLILKLLNNYQFKNLNIHQNIDNTTILSKPSEIEVRKHNISYSRWFNSKNEYLEFLENYGIYFASRPYEGGGLASFMDALKMGKVLVAPSNYPYLDYVEHGKTGILYDINDPSPINFDKLSLQKISKNAHESVIIGREQWIESIDKIHDYLFTNTSNESYLVFKSNLLKEFDNRWYRFGKLNTKQKIITIIKFLLKKIVK